MISHLKMKCAQLNIHISWFVLVYCCKCENSYIYTYRSTIALKQRFLLYAFIKTRFLLSLGVQIWLRRKQKKRALLFTEIVVILSHRHTPGDEKSTNKSGCSLPVVRDASSPIYNKSRKTPSRRKYPLARVINHRRMQKRILFSQFQLCESVEDEVT